MDNSLGRIAGVAAILLMLARIGLLLDTSETAPEWQLTLAVSVVLGGVVWWLLGQMMRNLKLRVAIFSVLGLILFLRIAAPDTLIGGVVPSSLTIPTLSDELAQTLDLIRYGVSPVFPTPGLVGVLAILMWIIGALYAWGASGGPTWAMVIPALALYLQFSVMDRNLTQPVWMVASIAVIALAVAAIALDRRTESGRVRDVDGRPMARRTNIAAVVVALSVGLTALLATTASAGLVPTGGNLQWRLGGAYGPGFGGVSFDRLADLQQRIITRTNAQLFRARLSEGAPPANEVYWRMESLDIFDGARWRPSVAEPEFYEPGTAGGDPEYAYRGTSSTFTARVQIDQLRMPVVPIPGIARALQSDTLPVGGFQVTADGSVLFQPNMTQGDQFQVEAAFPLTEEDLGALASMPGGGELSPLFANASEGGEFSAEPAPAPGPIDRPEDISRFLTLPSDTPAGLVTLARNRTASGTTDFEKAWLLEWWFRDSGFFEYSSDVSTGHDSLNLVAWLTEAGSPNYRTGYCEQFAAAMAVLGRAVGIPSRVVWGFTPGKVRPQSDGSEVIEVRDNNAHAWVEMWMDGFGWVKFDPTPRGDNTQPPAVSEAFNPSPYLPPPNADTDGPVRPPFVEDGFSEGERDPELVNPGGVAFEVLGWWWLLPVVALLVSAIPATKAVRRRRRRARLSEGDITAAWEEIVDRLADLGDPIPEHETPLEFAARADRRLLPIARSYSATVYGGREGTGSPADMDVIDRWVKQAYEEADRAKAAFNVRSLLPKE